MGIQQLPSARRPPSDLAAMLANSGSLTNAVLISALLRSSKLPDMFVEVEDDRAAVCTQSSELLDIPVIDLSKLSTGEEADRQTVVHAMAEACEKWGFLQVSNHGVDLRLIERCEAQAHRLFELPLEAKERAHRAPGEKFGYGANTWVDQTVRHWAESFSLQLHPYSNITEYASTLFESDYEDFSETLEEYMGAVEKLARQLTELLAEGLGLLPTRLNHYFEDATMTSMRLNLYPPCPQPELAIGLRAHTDPHLLTILHQDNVVGLQVQINDQWITVKPRPECFVVNVGDLFQILSNKRYKSVLHRAIVNGTSKRLSMACFLNPPLSATIVAPDELITPQRPRIYRAFTFQDFLSDAYTHHPKGAERPEQYHLAQA
ncbi:hypothetical protein CY35_05G147100 [Sphagnum magellanicum]|nr:hypothetical protein CY35_05G147100 [Sphagnum magellanicum]